MKTNTKAAVTGDRLGVHRGYRRFLGTSCDYLCTALTDLLRIRGYSREKAGLVCHTKSMELSQHF